MRPGCDRASAAARRDAVAVQDRLPRREFDGVEPDGAEVLLRPGDQLFPLAFAPHVADVGDALEERVEIGARHLYDQDARAVRANRVGVTHVARPPAELAGAELD